MKPRTQRDGFAMLTVVLLVFLLAAAISIVVTNMMSAARGTTAATQQLMLEEGVKAGIDQGISQVWGQYLAATPVDDRNLATYRTYLDTILADDPGGNFVDLNGAVVYPHTISGSAVSIQSVRAQRIDDPTGSSITVESVASINGVQKAAQQTIRVSGSLFEGFEFAILANNINCILCHAKIRNLELEWNNDPSTRPTGDLDGNGVPDYEDNYDTFDRVRMAALESFLVRPSGAHSDVAGTVYTRGLLYDNNGNPLGSLDGTTFTGYDFTSGEGLPEQNGKLIQDSSGNMTGSTLHLAGTDGEGNLNPFEHLYTQYPVDEGAQTDGVVPNNFPAPYPDDGGVGGSVNDAGNRLVDLSEFTEIMNTADGQLSGGVIHGISDGQVYDPGPGGGLPATSNPLPPYSYVDGEGVTQSVTGAYDGNVILVGTDENPIVIDGSVAINGDLVIQGVVKGNGQLQVKGNTYVVGDVTYADNAPQGPGGKPFGLNITNGVEVENALALVSGGNILMGDYLTVRGKNDSGNNSKYPNKKYSIDFRDASKTKVVNGETLHYGYFDPGVVDPGEYQDTMFLADGTEVPRDGKQFSFTTSELMLFNELELQKALAAHAAGEDYTARFYGLRESQAGNLYIYDYGDEHSVRYDEGGGEGARVKLLSEYLGAGGAEAALIAQILAESTALYMNPKGNWLSEETLRQIWWDDEMARPANSPFTFDGLLYTNNALIAMAHSTGRHSSHKDGQMILRGAIVASDLGILSPQGISVLYDKRVRRFLQVEDVMEVEFSRRFFRYTNVPEEEVVL